MVVGFGWVVGFVVAVVAVGIRVRLGYCGGWQWLAVGVGVAVAMTRVPRIEKNRCGVAWTRCGHG